MTDFQSNPLRGFNACTKGRIFLALKPYSAVGLLFAVSLATVWQILRLGYIPETPAQDLAKHVASILNFKDAFFDGQYLPRLQLMPTQIPDLPVFQFYGSLTGFLCMPFLMLGFEPITALTLGVLLIRWIGAIAIHNTGRLMGANSWSSSLAGVAYLLTPYMISNFYGRVAIPEATAHGVIAVLFYGVIRLYYRADAAAVVIAGLAIVALSLAHPIFLLFGCLVAAIFSVLLLRWWFLLLVGCVFVGGMLLASFQWLPGFLYHSDFATNFTEVNPFYRSDLTSYSGLFGQPHSLAEEHELLDEARLFLTPGILTIPVLVMLAFKIKQPLVRATFGCLLVVLVASYSPFNLWEFVPEFFWTLQFPYRLLSIVALLTSIGLCLTLKHLRPYQWVILVAVLIVQSSVLLLQQPYSVPLVLAKNEKALHESFANEDYSTKSLQVVTGDGWLLHYAKNIYDEELQPLEKSPKLVDGRGILLKNNSLNIGFTASPEKYIRVSGRITQNGRPETYAFWMAYYDEPSAPVDGVHIMKPGKFSTIFKVPNDKRPLTIQCKIFKHDLQNVHEVNCPNILLSSIELMPGNGIVVSDVTPQQTILTIKGESIFPDVPVDLWLASPIAPEIPVSERVSVGPGNFVASLSLPGSKGVYMIVASRYLVPALETPGSQDFRRLSVSISLVTQVVKNSLYIDVPFTEVLKTESGGYKRVFKVKDSAATLTHSSDKQIWKIQLPMAYSRMIEVTQNSEKLKTRPTDRGLISVQTHDQLSPIVPRFLLPQLALLGTLLGSLILVILAWRIRGLVSNTDHDPSFRDLFR